MKKEEKATSEKKSVRKKKVSVSEEGFNGKEFVEKAKAISSQENVVGAAIFAISPEDMEYYGSGSLRVGDAMAIAAFVLKMVHVTPEKFYIASRLMSIAEESAHGSVNDGSWAKGCERNGCH